MNAKHHHRILSVACENEFESVYVDLRIAENRMYSDEEVMWLPEVDEQHIHKKEWDIRRYSCKKLTRYLSNKRRPLKILEVGCGNGWLSYQLSQLPYSNVTGLDINQVEIRQAERVFTGISNLRFIYGSVDAHFLQLEKFDIVVFAASIQYFKSFRQIIEMVLQRLNSMGEIHIIDSHFYFETEIEEARQRSQAYFQSKGFEQMDDFYFHHSLKELDGFNYTILYNPHSVVNKILRRKNPFYWVRIKK